MKPEILRRFRNIDETIQHFVNSGAGFSKWKRREKDESKSCSMCIICIMSIRFLRPLELMFRQIRFELISSYFSAGKQYIFTKWNVDGLNVVSRHGHSFSGH